MNVHCNIESALHQQCLYNTFLPPRKKFYFLSLVSRRICVGLQRKLYITFLLLYWKYSGNAALKVQKKKSAILPPITCNPRICIGVTSIPNFDELFTALQKFVSMKVIKILTSFNFLRNRNLVQKSFTSPNIFFSTKRPHHAGVGVSFIRRYR